MSSSPFTRIQTFLVANQRWLVPGVLLLMSCLMYLSFLHMPKSMFWDENYHIVSAQKHVDGIMYMEPHPPLGKMLMGLSESIFGLNEGRDMSALTKTDYLKGEDLPKGTEFFGFRFPSAFLMAISVFFFYQTLLLITKSRWVAGIFSLFLIFDNALVVHNRSVMLEGIQIFFLSLAIWYTARCIFLTKAVTLKNYALLGFFVGLCVVTKVNGLILALLCGILFLEEQWQRIFSRDFLLALEKGILGGVTFIASGAFIVLFVLYIHIGMGQEIAPGKTYKASPEYLKSMKENGTWSFTTFRYGLKDHYRYHAEYADGVPRLDVCKDGENGSAWYKWPFGGKAINYRWSKNTINGEVWVNYTYLFGNPFVWLSAFAGIIMSLALIIGRFAFNTPIKDEKLFRWIVYFTGLYVSYMFVIAQIQRVMYMYHYFIPLIFAILNLALIFSYLFKEGLEQKSRYTIGNLVAIGFIVVGLFAWFSPFTFGFPINENQFELRNWFAHWDIEPVR